jgi:hypothetical protein
VLWTFGVAKTKMNSIRTIYIITSMFQYTAIVTVTTTDVPTPTYYDEGKGDGKGEGKGEGED